MTWDLFNSCFKWESLEHFEGRLDVSSHYSRSLILRLGLWTSSIAIA